MVIYLLYLSNGSKLVYRENTIRTAHVLYSVAVHFRSAEQIVIDYACPSSLISLNLNDGLPLIRSSSLYTIFCTSQLSLETTFV
jgi:hypothetical protein